MTMTLEQVKLFLQESRQELKRVNWPTKQETIRYTIFVVVFSIAFSVFLGIFDFAFLTGIENLIV